MQNLLLAFGFHVNPGLRAHDELHMPAVNMDEVEDRIRVWPSLTVPFARDEPDRGMHQASGMVLTNSGWGIQGVIRGGKGKVSAGTSSFRKMLGIKK